MLRKQINPNHPIIGAGYRLLNINDIIRESDETICISTALSLNGDTWRPVTEDMIAVSTQWWWHESPDANRNERIFRREEGV